MPVSVSTNHLAVFSVPLQDTVALPETLVQPVELTAVFGIELQYVQVPPIQLPGGAHYFRFAPTSNQKRWDQIKTDRVASLVWNNQVLEMSKANGTTFTLWMTLP